MFKTLWYCVLLHTVFGQSGFGFGTSYLKNSRLCRQWSCINTQLGFLDGLPPKDQFITTLQSLLPPGSWQNITEKVADTCYRDRPRSYTNTCPGQALMHCAVDHLIQYCPEDNLRQEDACAPLSTLAGFNYMFSQSRYENLEKNLPFEPRPAWFLKNYFSSSCCNLPVLFNSTVLGSCGFDSMINYRVHKPRPNGDVVSYNRYQSQKTDGPKSNAEQVKIVDINVNNTDIIPTTTRDADGILNMDLDPLECCDLSGFIEPSWRSECGFQITWSERYRLTIMNKSKGLVTSTVVPSTTVRPKWNDVKVVPQTCEKGTCVFRKLNIISETGSVDLDAFSKLLDNVTNEHTSWNKAKARVVTKCLSKPVKEYIDDCEINRVLACTFDVLSENCPHTKKHDPCKHTTVLKDDITCQISSSKLRPKNRRQFCGLPNLVSHEVLTECGLNSLSRMEYVPDPVTSKPKTHWWIKSKFACESSTVSTKCLLSKMDVLNKYGFLDYFKMKDRIRLFTSRKPEWFALTDVYLNTFTAIPMYGQQCSTPKKLLNVVDAMLMTCPISKRRPTLQCNRILTDMAFTAPADRTLNKARFSQVFTQSRPLISFNSKLPVIPEQPITRKTPAFDFPFMNTKDAPPVQFIDVKPTVTSGPLVMLPVYMRMTGKGIGSFSVRPYDGIMRSAPLHPSKPVDLSFPH